MNVHLRQEVTEGGKRTGVLWRSEDFFVVRDGHAAAQLVIAGWLQGGARWAVDAKSGAFIAGLGRNGERLSSAPCVCGPDHDCRSTGCADDCGACQ